jgi:hypothetical protein
MPAACHGRRVKGQYEVLVDGHENPVQRTPKIPVRGQQSPGPLQLLRASFIPDRGQRELRELVRTGAH